MHGKRMFHRRFNLQGKQGNKQSFLALLISFLHGEFLELTMVYTAKWSKEARSCNDIHFFMISPLRDIFQTYECTVLARKNPVLWSITSGYDHFTSGNVGENRAKAKDFPESNCTTANLRGRSLSLPWLRYYQVFLNCSTRWVSQVSLHQGPPSPW